MNTIAISPRFGMASFSMARGTVGTTRVELGAGVPAWTVWQWLDTPVHHLGDATASQHGLFLHGIALSAKEHFLTSAFLWYSVRQFRLALVLEKGSVLSSS